MYFYKAELSKAFIFISLSTQRAKLWLIYLSRLVKTLNIGRRNSFSDIKKAVSTEDIIILLYLRTVTSISTTIKLNNILPYLAAPPFPPQLSIASSSVSSLTLRLKPSDEAEQSPAAGYTIHYKQEFGDWETVQVTVSQPYTYKLFVDTCKLCLIWNQLRGIPPIRQVKISYKVYGKMKLSMLF